MGFNLVPFLFRGHNALKSKSKFTKNRKNVHFWKVVGPKKLFLAEPFGCTGGSFLRSFF